MKSPRFGAQRVVGVLHALGDAAEGEQFAEVVVEQEGAQRLVRAPRCRRPWVAAGASGALGERLVTRAVTGAWSAAGSLKVIRSSATTTSSMRQVEALAQPRQHLLHQHFRGAGAGGDAEERDALERGRGRGRARAAPSPRAGSRRVPPPPPAGPSSRSWARPPPPSVRRAAGDRLHRRLAVGGGVADVLLGRRRDAGEAVAAARPRSPRCRPRRAWSG